MLRSQRRLLKSKQKLVVCLFQFFPMMQEKYEQLKVGTDVQVGSAADDHLFFKASGGWSEKGTVYGLGREGPAMFERPITSRHSGGCTSSAYSSPIVTQL